MALVSSLITDLLKATVNQSCNKHSFVESCSLLQSKDLGSRYNVPVTIVSSLQVALLPDVFKNMVRVHVKTNDIGNMWAKCLKSLGPLEVEEDNGLGTTLSSLGNCLDFPGRDPDIVASGLEFVEANKKLDPLVRNIAAVAKDARSQLHIVRHTIGLRE